MNKTHWLCVEDGHVNLLDKKKTVKLRLTVGKPTLCARIV